MEIIKIELAVFDMSGQVFHVPLISANPHLRLCRIAERTKELSKTCHPQATTVCSFNELIEDPGIDLIVVSTSDSTHYEYIRVALKAEKNVVVEKSFTSTTERGKGLIALPEQKGLVLSVYRNRRRDADFLTAHDILNKLLSGRLVEYGSALARHRNFIKPNTWKEAEVSGGGLTYNLGSHLTDQAVQLFGMPEAVLVDLGVLRNEGKTGDYLIIHLLRSSLAPDVKITLKASYLMRETEPYFMLHGTLGSYAKYGIDKQEAVLLADEVPGSPNWREGSEQEWGLLHTEINGKKTCRKYPGISGNYDGFYQNIYEYLCLGRTLKTHTQGILNVTRIVEAAYQSRRETRIVNLK